VGQKGVSRFVDGLEKEKPEIKSDSF